MEQRGQRLAVICLAIVVRQLLLSYADGVLDGVAHTIIYRKRLCYAQECQKIRH